MLRNPFAIQIPVLLGYLLLVDILFLPYFQIIIMPISLPIVMIAYPLLNVRFINHTEFKIFLALGGTITISLIVSLSLKESQGYIIENSKRAIQLLSAFSYYFYFSWLSKTHNFGIRKLLLIFIAWYLTLSIAYLLQPSETQQFIQSIYGRITISEERSLIFRRFAYFFPDPNTAAYFFLTVFAFILKDTKTNKQTLLFYSIALVTVALSQSRGALLAYFLIAIVHTFPPRAPLSYISKARNALVFPTIIAVVALAGIFLLSSNLDTTLELVSKRFFEDHSSYKTGGTRFQIWARYCNELTPLPWGRGFQFDILNDNFYPHSDYIRFIYSYGFLSPFLFFYFVYKYTLKEPEIIMPIIMASAINSLIDDQKLMILFFSLLAIRVHRSIGNFEPIQKQ